jgi:hypothetical protein
MMRLKYKKMILLLTMGVMGIGMLTISFDKTTQADTNAVETTSDQVITLKEDPTNATPTEAATPTNGLTATPTQVPEDPLKLRLSDNPDINTLVETYYSAMLDTDEETLASIMTDPSVINIEVISKKLEYISSFHNIVCYTKPGIKEGDYVVYVAFDMEIASIDTYAPALDYLYVTTKDDKVYIMTGEIDEKIQTLRKDYFKTQEIIDLVKSVDEALTAACKSDQDLQEFYDNLTSSIKTTDPDSTTEESDDTPAN